MPETGGPRLFQRLANPTDTDAWCEFTDLYAPVVYRWCLLEGVTRNEAARLVAKIFAKLAGSRESFEFPQDARAYLWSELVKRRRRNALSCTVSAAETTPDIGPADLAPPPPDAEPSLPEAYAAAARLGIVGQLLHTLSATVPAEDWRAFWSVLGQGQSVAAAADELHTTPLALLMAKARVVRQFRSAARDVV